MKSLISGTLVDVSYPSPRGGGLILNIKTEEWHPAIFARRSRRQFDGRPMEPGVLQRLEEVCREFRPFPEARAVLVSEPPDDILKGAIGSYGKVKGALAYVAFIGDMDCPSVQEKVGYIGEGVILEATSLGVGTCWVGGFFRPDAVAAQVGVGEGERVLAVSPLGYAAGRETFEERIMSGFGVNHRRKPIGEICDGLLEEPWLRKALEAARLAPSAVNRQPWRFRLQGRVVTVEVDDLKDTYKISKRLDCGMAMLHFELGARHSGVCGEWEFLTAPRVARFAAQV